MHCANEHVTFVAALAAFSTSLVQVQLNLAGRGSGRSGCFLSFPVAKETGVSTEQQHCYAKFLSCYIKNSVKIYLPTGIELNVFYARDILKRGVN